jgi:uncharacterized membrane protein
MAGDQRTFGERVSDSVARFGGSWRFIFLFAAILFVWIVFNSLTVLDIIAFDKYPYILLNLLLSCVAALQAPFIMMSQNRTEAKQDEAYRTLFYEIKELIQQDIETSTLNEQNLREIKYELKTLRDKINNDGPSD